MMAFFLPCAGRLGEGSTSAVWAITLGQLLPWRRRVESLGWYFFALLREGPVRRSLLGTYRSQSCGENGLSADTLFTGKSNSVHELV